MVKEILEALADLTKKNAGELIGQWFDSAEGEELKPKEGVNVPEQVAELVRAKIREVGNDQHGRGKRETAESWEKMIRKAGLKDTSLKGQEALDALLSQVKTGSKKVDAITPDVLEQSKEAQQWLNEKVKALKEAKEAAESQVAQVKNEYSRKQVINTAKSKAVEILDSMKWVDGGDDLRTKRVNTIHRLIDFDKLQLTDDGNLIVLDDKGQPAKDADFNPVTFDQLVKSVNPFGVHKHDPSKQTPSPKRKAGENGNGSTLVINSMDQIPQLKKEAYQIRDIKERNAKMKEINQAAAEFVESQNAG